MRLVNGKWLSLAAVLFLCAGCVGTNFVRPSEDSLILGKTTKQDIQQRFGEARHKGTGIQNEQPVETLAYSYASGGGGLVGGVIPARAITYSFYNGKLIGYQFGSSFGEDSSDFDDKAVSRIIKGTTREEEVVKLLGKPTGRFIYPVADKDGTTLGYFYSETRGPTIKLKLYQKILRINVGPDGVVTDVKLSTFGDR